MTVNDRPRLVTKALRAIRKGGDTRALHRELAADNPYAHAFLERRGLVYRDGAIVQDRITFSRGIGSGAVHVRRIDSASRDLLDGEEQK